VKNFTRRERIQHQLTLHLIGLEGSCAVTRSDGKFSVFKMNPYHPKLIEAYCPGCGLLIAASPRPDVLRILERIHACPVYFQYPKGA